MRAYERFIKYVQIDTTSTESSGTHPSFTGEFDLARVLREELEAMGLERVRTDENCYTYGYLPASTGYENATALGFIAHVDTVDDALGTNVKPILHENFNGESVTLPGSGFVMTADKYPALRLMKGETLITSDGTTLLGADDKAGVAEIMTMVETLAENKEIKHGPIAVCFTPDEEIGEGADFFDVEGFGAKYAYTVDGGDADCIEYKNFNAAEAKIYIKGLSVHPGDAKNTMINASKVAMEFHGLLPQNECPENTEGFEGFYHLTDMKGRTADAFLNYIIRDHDRKSFEERKKTILGVADRINAKYGAGTAKIELEDQYYNMVEKIEPHMHLVDNAIKAIETAGLVAKDIAIRGGTDGAVLSFKGLPCPNLGTGGFHFHGEQECTSVERLDKVTEILLNIVDIYSKTNY